MNNGPAKMIDLDPQPGDVIRCVKYGVDGWLYSRTIKSPVAVESDGSWYGIGKDFFHELRGEFIVISRAERKET